MSPCYPLVQDKKRIGFLCTGAVLQSATRWYDPNIGWTWKRGRGMIPPKRRCWVRWSPYKRLRTTCCRRMRQARYLLVKPDYAELDIYCSKGHGCDPISQIEVKTP